MQTQPLNIAFFGTPEIAVIVLQELKQAGIIPSLIITNPDRAQGRGLRVTEPPVKQWALQEAIEVFQPESLKEKETLTILTEKNWDLFIVVAYGLMMPKWLIELPKHGTLNLHPSMLPKLRGASPIRTSILEGLKDTGVSIMLMDEKMDHGPILAQQKIELSSPIPGRELDDLLAHEGGELLAETIGKWVTGLITPKEQNHNEATFSQKITREMGELHINPHNLPQGTQAYQMYLKICAFDGWPGTFFFHAGKRIKITNATLTAVDTPTLEIQSVIPEGKKEMPFSAFLKYIHQ